MPQGFNGSDVNLSQKTGGQGKSDKRGKVTTGNTPMKVRPFPAPPGKSGPNRQAGFGTKVKQHAQDKGL